MEATVIYVEIKNCMAWSEILVGSLPEQPSGPGQHLVGKR